MKDKIFVNTMIRKTEAFSGIVWVNINLLLKENDADAEKLMI